MTRSGVGYSQGGAHTHTPHPLCGCARTRPAHSPTASAYARAKRVHRVQTPTPSKPEIRSEAIWVRARYLIFYVIL